MTALIPIDPKILEAIKEDGFKPIMVRFVKSGEYYWSASRNKAVVSTHEMGNEYIVVEPLPKPKRWKRLWPKDVAKLFSENAAPFPANGVDYAGGIHGLRTITGVYCTGGELKIMDDRHVSWDACEIEDNNE